MTITKPRKGDEGPDRFRPGPEFRALIDRILAVGTSRLSPADRLSISEVARQKETHHDPHTRKRLQAAYTEIAKAHLEYCLKAWQ
jgi:hypothetical protein